MQLPTLGEPLVIATEDGRQTGRWKQPAKSCPLSGDSRDLWARGGSGGGGWGLGGCSTKPGRLRMLPGGGCLHCSSVKAGTGLPPSVWDP